jgi:high-affinity nickel-transport protein
MVLRPSVPESLSLWMQRVVGFTLILLSIYVFAAIFSGSGPLSRGQAIAMILSRRHWRKRIEQKTPNQGYGARSSMTLGVLHGIGAETPTQLSMLVITTNLGGLSNGVLGLLVFAMAMFLSNMALTAIATGTFSISRPRPVLFRSLGAITASYSLWIGIMLMFSRAAG